jgi:2-keto-4-pentenoate hydratase/2-oxohepta-3-ene-1,7-dioic acid hydratase in catechol pathway
MYFDLPVLHQSGTYRLRPSKILGIGLNYLDHVREDSMREVRGFQAEVPAEPVVFAMTPNVLIPNGAPVILPRFVEACGFASPRVDYEAELAFVVKDRCKNVPESEALAHVLGYTCMNDVTQRNLQKGDASGWFRGKSLDSFGPVGPVLAPAELIPDPQNLSICCRLNGGVVQQYSTRQMIFSVAQLLSFLSRNFTLEAGDLITTGTPSGVGPLAHGDVVEVEIEGIGVLRNPVESER